MAESNKLSSEELAKLREQLKREAANVNVGNPVIAHETEATEEGAEKEPVSSKVITVTVLPAMPALGSAYQRE